MDAARQVLERLRRIETLRETGAQPGALVPELQALLAEGGAWLAAEGAAGTGLARRALDELETALERRPDVEDTEEVVVAQAAL
jgi:hypothetical protein